MVMQFPLYLDNKHLALLEVPSELTRESYNLLKEELEFYLTVIEQVNVDDNTTTEIPRIGSN